MTTLTLRTGETFAGKGFGADVACSGEVVFNTGMTGYQEMMTDPSYAGQILVFTYPMIGNYGINRRDAESIKPSLKGVVVKKASHRPHHHQAMMNLHEWLTLHGIPGLMDVDTRMLARLIRERGTVTGSFGEGGDILTNQVAHVASEKATWIPGGEKRVVLLDFGSKKGIIRELTRRGLEVIVVPHTISAREIDALHPDGIVISNGPGDPVDVSHVLPTIQTLCSTYPTFGICLGHQLIALAHGAKTEKMVFGHRGGNHPVMDKRKNVVSLSSQNHSYSVVRESLAQTDFVETFVNVNDDSVEGIMHKELPVMSVQFHPEAAPGPVDTSYLFDEFMTMMVNVQKRGMTYA
ncbi:carbamoyl phosphate synthase small subunit [Paenalkalicoccus suaedae]|uniref:Carbamoyl phosphate synthase small chain n=1 Tax=Paenalkalicoccus suaedae TaxID=2592382 RepID=A0A859FE91_9BACI|nr:carbamoyl phosphate synthase small subunit [Paenalkalicoccus suaedae]QKS71499.1 carbamoyl phosphate synthase small subunit [Paenalkalicoccus suaedae]